MSQPTLEQFEALKNRVAQFEALVEQVEQLKKQVAQLEQKLQNDQLATSIGQKLSKIEIDLETRNATLQELSKEQDSQETLLQLISNNINKINTAIAVLDKQMEDVKVDIITIKATQSEHT